MALPTTIKLASEIYNVYEDTTVFGDGAVVIGNYLIGGNDIFKGEANAYNGYTAVGDAIALIESGMGGNDKFIGGVNSGGSSGDWDFFFPATSAPSSGDGDPVVFIGDAEYAMYDTSVGGNDTMTGGRSSNTVFFGDAYYLGDSAKGGKDSIVGGASSADDWGYDNAGNQMLGDGYGLTSNVVGGADTLTGGAAGATDWSYASNMNLLVGDGYGVVYGAKGGADKITAGHGTANMHSNVELANVMIGDGYYMDWGSMGAADTLQGGNLTLTNWSDGEVFNMMAGDALLADCGAIGANDTLAGGSVTASNVDDIALVYNWMVGDFMGTMGDSWYGSDKITGGSASAVSDSYAVNFVFGDTMGSDGYITDFGGAMAGAAGSIDDLTSLLSSLSGGAQALGGAGTAGDEEDGQVFGNDTIVGGNNNAYNVLVGDSSELQCGDVGGNDRITAGKTLNFYIDSEILDGYGFFFQGAEVGIASHGSPKNYLYGDGYSMDWGSQGGNDVLISNTGNDVMYGDAVENCGEGGADRFVFGVGNGTDVIGDFDVCEDKIDLYALRYNAQLRSLDAILNSGRLEQDGCDVILQLDTFADSGSNTVRLVGVDICDLTSANFLFTYLA